MLNKIIKCLKLLMVFLILLILTTNFYVILTTKDRITTLKQASSLKDVDFVLVLGAGIKNKQPSPMLEDRLKLSILLQQSNNSYKILVSGDHISDDYDEVNVMKNYLLENNIPEENVYQDHAGISTYDSIYRLKYVYNAKKVIIITQKYHLYRALYIANALNIDAYGLSSNQRKYYNQEKRDLREILARTKDCIKAFFQPPSTYLTDIINSKH